MNSKIYKLRKNANHFSQLDKNYRDINNLSVYESTPFSDAKDEAYGKLSSAMFEDAFNKDLGKIRR